MKHLILIPILLFLASCSDSDDSCTSYEIGIADATVAYLDTIEYMDGTAEKIQLGDGVTKYIHLSEIEDCPNVSDDESWRTVFIELIEIDDTRQWCNQELTEIFVGVNEGGAWFPITGTRIQKGCVIISKTPKGIWLNVQVSYFSVKFDKTRNYTFRGIVK